MKKQQEQSQEKTKQSSKVVNNKKTPLQKVQSNSQTINQTSTQKQKEIKVIDTNNKQNDSKNIKSSDFQPLTKKDNKIVPNQTQTNRSPQVPKKPVMQIQNHQTGKSPQKKFAQNQQQKLTKSKEKQTKLLQKDQFNKKASPKDKFPQKSKVSQSNQLNQSLKKQIDVSKSKPKDGQKKVPNQIQNPIKQTIKKDMPNIPIEQNSKKTKLQNPSKSVIVQSPSKLQANKNKKQINKVSQISPKLQIKQIHQNGISKETPNKDIKQFKIQLPKSPNKDKKSVVIEQNQSPLKRQLKQRSQENLSKGNGAKINTNGNISNEIQSFNRKSNNQITKKGQKEQVISSIPERVVQSAPQSPRVVESKYSAEDIERLKFLKKLKKEKKLIEQRLKQQKQLEQMEQERMRQQKERQLLRQQSQQKANKLRNIQSRLEQIERRKEDRKRQISERNRQYLQKKTQFTLEHKIINQWLQKQMEENKIKQKQLQSKISKMKPVNHLQSIKDHIQLIQSYRQMHNSRFKQEDLKFERSKSRIQLEKMYKSNWYKQIQQNDPTKTFKIQQEKRKAQKQLLLMKIDNMKKYAEYVKINHQPDNTEQSVFKYSKPIIKNFTAQQIKRMGIDNLSYCKEIVEKNPKRISKASLSEHNQPPKYQDYLQKLKTDRQKKQNFGSQQDFDQLVQNIKNSTSLTKDQKIKRITHLAQKMEKKAQQKEQIFNRTNTSRLKILQNKTKDSLVHQRQSSLPFLKQRSASQPKLKITDNHKNLLQKESKNKNSDFMKEIDEKLMLLKNI